MVYVWVSVSSQSQCYGGVYTKCLRIQHGYPRSSTHPEIRSQLGSALPGKHTTHMRAAATVARVSKR